MSGRYIPPAARRTEPGGNEEPSTGTIQSANIDQLLGRSLEELSLSQPSENSSNSRGRGGYRGQNRGYNRGNQRGWHQNRGQGRGRSGGGGSNYRGRWSTSGNQHNNQDRKHFYLRPPHDDEFFLHEIEAHFWPETEAVRTSEKSTLNDSFEHKDQLAYVMLFKDANPRWEDDGIIFAKTSIDLLPGYEKAFEHPGVVEMDEESMQAFAQEEEAMKAQTADEAPGKTESGADATPIVEQEELKADEAPGSTDSGVDKTSAVVKQPALKAHQAPDNADSGVSLDAVNKEGSITDGPQKDISKQADMTTDDTFKDINTDNKPTADDGPLQISTSPIAIFSQTLPGRNNSSIYFSFQGWYTVGNVEFLYPRSKALAKMMAQKWDLKDSFGRSRTVKRDRSGWLKSMNQRWAVVKFVKVEEQEPMPGIQRLQKAVGDAETETGSGSGNAGDEPVIGHTNGKSDGDAEGPAMEKTTTAVPETEVQNGTQQSDSINTPDELANAPVLPTDAPAPKKESDGA